MKYYIAICEDSDVDRNYLAKLIDFWAQQRKHNIKINMFSSAENFLFNYNEEIDFQILFLDIQMGHMDGITMAKKIRKCNSNVQIIFATGYLDYISEGYDVEALHYLIKPVKEEKLFSVLDRAIEKLAKNEKVLNLKFNGEIIRIPIYQINYAEVFGNYVTIYAFDKFTIKMTLKDLEKQLDERFFRVGRSVLVNLTKINKVTKSELKICNDILIPIPRGAYDGINKAIINMR